MKKSPVVSESDPQQLTRLDLAIRQRVIGSLGQPPDCRAVQVRRLWDNHYRVNVFTGGDFASAKVANSYFLRADSEGNIIESTPRIIRQY